VNVHRYDRCFALASCRFAILVDPADYFCPRMNRYIFLLLGSAVAWSLGGVLIKSVDWNPIAIAGSRSFIAVLVIAALMPRVLRRISWPIVPGALAYAGTVILFVVSTKLTTAANAIFLQYTAPIYIALIGPWLLREKTKRLDWIIIAIALGGIALFFIDRLSLQGLWGIVAGLASGFCFALLTVSMRHQREGSPEAIILLGNLITFFFALPFIFPIENLSRNALGLVLLGVVQLAIPYLMYAIAIRHVRALDAALISIIEPILNPLWVMLATGERPAFWSIIGGAIVLAASLMRTLLRSSGEPPIVTFPNPEAIEEGERRIGQVRD
jgi:drug/metabolite transporter (DMT)-like permease